MALQSHMVPIGTPMPDVTLPNLEGEEISLRSQSAGRPLVVMFLCNHCPYVKHIEQQLADVSASFTGQGVGFVGICSNDVDSHPDDGPEGLQSQVERTGWQFPYLVDSDQSVAKAFHAACTPDFFVYDQAGRLAYRGALDASNPKNGKPLNGADLRNAITLILKSEAVPEPHRPSMGCGIKWSAGNEPDAVSFL